jgi:hypothetical protein
MPGARVGDAVGLRQAIEFHVNPPRRPSCQRRGAQEPRQRDVNGCAPVDLCLSALGKIRRATRNPASDSLAFHNLFNDFPYGAAVA